MVSNINSLIPCFGRILHAPFLGMSENRSFKYPAYPSNPLSTLLPVLYRTRQSSSPDTIHLDQQISTTPLTLHSQTPKKTAFASLNFPYTALLTLDFRPSLRIWLSPTPDAMKAFGFLIAGAALLHGAMAQLTKSPAPNSSLGNGWRYKGCYSSVTLHSQSASNAELFQ